MKCGMVKGGVVGLGLATAALFWVFGGRAWDLVQAKADKGKEWVRSHATSFDDEITLARKQVEKLGPAIGEGAEALSKLIESVNEAEADVQKQEKTLAQLEARVRTLSDRYNGGNVQRVSGSSEANAQAIKVGLSKAIDSYHQAESTVSYSRDALTYRKAQVQEAHARLEEMKAKRQTLISKINEIEARHKARVAARQFNEFTIDTSPLAEAEKAVSQLNSRENVDARADDLKNDLSQEPVAVDEELDSRDLNREVSEILKTSGATKPDHDA